ncbi:MAG: hypothetical protein A2V83_04100 [Nitrospirae bacterium RBG_16_64_22]|nr:MAG: hypothetical protein A2V83_04100 [Nitrospirae bacterium RBG_16_64_22]
MIEKIPVEQLMPGMFVHDLDCGWFGHPFFTSRFRVDGDRTVAKIAEAGIREVYIDTSKGLDVSDLSLVSGRDGGARIVGYESPKRWNIDPQMFL